MIKKSVFAAAIFFLLGACLASAAKKSKWQSMLERNGVPQIFWEKYLPKVSRQEYRKSVKNYTKSVEGRAPTDAAATGGSNDSIRIVEGKYALPANSGKIALEQHLWLKSNQSAANHYEATDTPSSCRNGMAGGFGSFGPLDKGDGSEEKYYVTMRWGYADWLEPESDTAENVAKEKKTLMLKSGENFPKSGFVKIGDEYIKYASKSGDKLKGLKRGHKSSAASHGKGSSVKLVYNYKGGHWERLTRALRPNAEKKNWFKKKKVLVTNERNGKKVVASILESGPAIWTNRVGGLSPEAFRVIGAKNNEVCDFRYVDEDTKLGEVD